MSNGLSNLEIWLKCQHFTLLFTILKKGVKEGPGPHGIDKIKKRRSLQELMTEIKQNLQIVDLPTNCSS